MLLSAGTLLSKCCNAVIVMDGNKYQCCACTKHCESAGTIGDQVAGERKLARLERGVIEAAKTWAADFNFTGQFANAKAITAHKGLGGAVKALESFEAKQK